MARQYHVELVLYSDEGDDIDVVEDEIISHKFEDETNASRFFWDLRSAVLSLKFDPTAITEVKAGLLELQEADEE